MMIDNKAENLFLKTISSFDMPPEDGEVLCAVSGGADSVALLHLFLTHKDALGLANLSACHINHCLRGDESDHDERFVRELCLLWDIPLHVWRQDARAFAKERGLSTEDGARQLRYSVFEQLREDGAVVATAHTLSDSIETFFINAVRGTGIDGLGGIPPIRGNIIRPLINCTRADVEEYLDERGIEYVTDSTNFEDIYVRNKVRNHIVPQLKAINRGFEAAVARTMGLLREDALLLGRIAGDALKKCESGGGYDVSQLLSYGELLPRLMREIGLRAGVTLEHRHVELCAKAVKSGRGAVQISGSHSFYVHQGIAYFVLGGHSRDNEKESFVLHKRILLDAPLTVELGSCKLSLSVFDFKQIRTDCEFSKKTLKSAVDYDKIGDTVVFRPHLPSDRITQPGRGVTKQVKKLISEARVPVHMRRDIIVALSEEKVIWADMFGHDESAAPDSGTKRVIVFTNLC